MLNRGFKSSTQGVISILGESMNKLEFIRKLDASSVQVSDSTADFWWHLLSWVSLHGYADTADSPEFVSYVQGFRSVTVATINRHLARMTKAGFLKAYEARRRLPVEVKEDLNQSISALAFGGGTSALPTSFKRYALPGTECSQEFKSVSVALERSEALHKSVVASVATAERVPSTDSEALNWLNPKSVRVTGEAPGYMTRTIEVLGDDGRTLEIQMNNAVLVALAVGLLGTIKREAERGHKPLDWPDFDPSRDLPPLVRQCLL
jgi:hypothetical protein